MSGTSIAHGITLGDYAGLADPNGVAAFATATGSHAAYAADYMEKGNSRATMDSATTSRRRAPRPTACPSASPFFPGWAPWPGGHRCLQPVLRRPRRDLVADNEANRHPATGSEFNGNWSAWSIGNATDAANFVAFCVDRDQPSAPCPGEVQVLLEPQRRGPRPTPPSRSSRERLRRLRRDRRLRRLGGPPHPCSVVGTSILPAVGLNWWRRTRPSTRANRRPRVVQRVPHRRPRPGTIPCSSATWRTRSSRTRWPSPTSGARLVLDLRNNLLDGTFPGLAQFKVDFG